MSSGDGRDCIFGCLRCRRSHDTGAGGCVCAGNKLKINDLSNLCWINQTRPDGRVLLYLNSTRKSNRLFKKFMNIYDLSQHHLRPILQRLCQMRRLNCFAPRQVCYRAREFQDAVIGARRELQLAHGRFDQTLPGFVQFTKLAHLGHAHIGIADQRCARKAFALVLARAFHPFANIRRGFPQSVTGQFFIVHARDFNMNVNPVQQRA